MGIFGPMKTKSINGRFHALEILDDYTAYSSVFILLKETQVYGAVCEYMARAERSTGFKLQSIRLDGAGEHKGDIISVLKSVRGILHESSPSYAPQINEPT